MPDEPAIAPNDTAAFAAALRRLRLDADSPTLSRLQHETGISRTVLSEAFGGRKLPSARTVDRIVRACGDDPAELLARRDAIAAASGATPEPDLAPTGGVEAAAGPNASPRVLTRGRAAWWAVAAFALGSVASATVASLVVSAVGAARLDAAVTAAVADALADADTAADPDATAEDAPLITVHDGDDPGRTPCVDDAAVAAADPRDGDSLLEIIWSDACQAGWGRVTRYDGLAAGNTVTIAIYPQTSADGPARQESTEHDVQGAYTMLVVRPSPDTLLCAEGSFTVDGERVDLGDPICT